MTDYDLDHADTDIAMVRRVARRSAHVQRAQVMLLAACLTTLGVVAVAGAMLTNLL